MHILRIDIQNIRGIEHQEIDLRLADESGEPRHRLIILGGNGTGKTTLLVSLAHLFAELTRDETDENRPGSPRLGAGDVRLAGARASDTEIVGRVAVDGYLTHDEYQHLDDKSGVARTLELRTTLGGLRLEDRHLVQLTLPTPERIRNLGDKARAALQASLDVNVQEARDSKQAFIDEVVRYAPAPPCVFLPADRGTLNDTGDVPVSRLLEFSRRKRCLEHTRERFETLPSLLALAYAAPKRNDPDGIVARMWKVLAKYFPRMPRPVDVHGLELLFETETGAIVTLSQLSDGQRALLLIFGEVALRNPENGVVLVDEIEQHLHPRWQREIVAALPALIPSAQFIFTTQAPYVAASAPDDVFIMGDWHHDGPQAEE